MNKRILALDLGTRTGIYNGIDFPYVLELDRDLKIVQFYRHLIELISKDLYLTNRPYYDIIVIENAICQIAKANESFHQLKAIVRLVCQQYDMPPPHELSPKHIKKVFVGKHDAEKEEIIDKVLEMKIGLPYKIMSRGKNKGTKRYDDNAADAVAVYYTYLKDMEAKNE